MNFETFMKAFNGMNNEHCKIHLIETFFPIKNITWDQMTEILKLFEQFDGKIKALSTMIKQFSKITMKKFFDLLSFTEYTDNKKRLIAIINDNKVTVEYESDAFVTFIKSFEYLDTKKDMLKTMLNFVPESKREEILVIIAENDEKDSFVTYCKTIGIEEKIYSKICEQNQNKWEKQKECNAKKLKEFEDKNTALPKQFDFLHGRDLNTNAVINGHGYNVEIGKPLIIGNFDVNSDGSFGDCNTIVAHTLMNNIVFCIRSSERYALKIGYSCIIGKYEVKNTGADTIEIKGDPLASNRKLSTGHYYRDDSANLYVFRNLDGSANVYKSIISSSAPFSQKYPAIIMVC